MEHKNFRIISKLNDTSDAVRIACMYIEKACEELGMTYAPVAVYSEGGIVFAVGGDGTMIEAMKQSAGTNAIVVGVNMGRVGFLTDVNIRNCGTNREFADFIKQVVQSKDSTSTERMLLINNLRPNILAMNEYTVSANRPDGLVEYTLWIDEFCAGTHRANSVIISTPTGSTAYSLSAGGSIMMPELEAIQITPVAAMSMTSRSIIVGAESKVAIQVKQSVFLNCDGQRISHYDAVDKTPIRFEFQAADRKVRVLHNEGWNFFHVLSEKLGWNNK